MSGAFTRPADYQTQSKINGPLEVQYVQAQQAQKERDAQWKPKRKTVVTGLAVMAGVVVCIIKVISSACSGCSGTDLED